MKKMIVSLALFCLASCLLCACGKETPLLTIEDYKLDAESGSTSLGVKIGDDAEAFQTAYQDYMMFSAIEENTDQTDTTSEEGSDAASRNEPDAVPEAVSETSVQSNYQFVSAGEIPFDTVNSIILPTFFIDGHPVDMDQFCEENEIEKENLLSYLTNASYLSNHKVIYRYLVFIWENGVITDIRSESMDYNQDASYYEAN